MINLNDIRKVDIIHINDIDNSEYINSYNNLMLNENLLLSELTTDKFLIETNDYIDKILSYIENNILYQNILYYREILNEYGYDLSFKTDEDTIYNYGDVLNINLLYIKQLSYDFFKAKSGLDIDGYIVTVSDDNGLYYGSVIMFTHPNYPYVIMYGIKRSILDIITGSRINIFKGISKLLIDKIKEFCYKNIKKSIIVANPLDPMVPILDHYGFKIIFDEESDEYQFVSSLIYGNNYYILAL